MARTVPPQPAPEASPGETIRVDITNLLFDDVLLFQSMDEQGDGKLTPAVIEALDRVVEGGIRRRKLSDLPAIMQAVAAATVAAGNAGN